MARDAKKPPLQCVRGTALEQGLHLDADIQDIKSDANGFHIKSLSYQRSKHPVFTVEVTKSWL
jgi:hypothetical protein